MGMWATILVVDDEKNTREGLKPMLQAWDYDVTLAQNGREALEIMKDDCPDVVLTDLKMPEMDGLELLNQIKRKYPHVIVIILTAYGTVETAVKAMQAGAYYYLTKPINFEELELILKKALHQRSLEQENVNLRAELMQERHEAGEIIGNSEVIKKVIATAKQVAETDSTVLIQGESGTGKELFAHLIHNASQRRNQSMITVHMAALTETLLASELFGHEKGAFTGATERRVGRFERANGGTLFLDEVSEIPEGMQTKLLRVIQDGDFERVGGTKNIKTNVRLICATNKNLKDEVGKGKFREDLYYRINVILLEVPPLRDRRSDIPLFADYFLKYFSRVNRKNVKTLTPEAITALKQYSWPGNIRELKNIIERAVVLSNTESIDLAQIPDDIQLNQPSLHEASMPDKKSFESIRGMEDQMIRNALKQCAGNKSLAAKKLGISRRTLYRKMDEYKISD